MFPLLYLNKTDFIARSHPFCSWMQLAILMLQCTSVRLSVTCWYCIETTQHRLNSLTPHFSMT